MVHPRRARSAALTTISLFALCPLLTGCFSSTPPTLRVTGARVGPTAGTRAVLLIDVVATNPNQSAIPLKGVTYRVDLSGEKVFEGTRDAQASVRGYGVQTFTLPVPVSTSYLSRGATFRVSGDVTYVAPETLANTLYDNGLRSWSTAFAGEGVVGVAGMGGVGTAGAGQ